MEFLTQIISVLDFLIVVLFSVAFITVVERKALAAAQSRIGPNIVGIFGIAQAFADALKLMVKETLYIIASNRSIFFLSPILIFILSIMNWGVLAFDEEHVLYTFPLNLLVIALVTSLMSQHILFSGWSSGSKYALLGSLRATAQFISYEMFISLALLNVTLFHQTLAVSDIIADQALLGPSLPMFYLAFGFFFVATMAEANRTPFDLPEAEGELVAGYHVEYTALTFAFFYISEYASFLFNALFIDLMFCIFSSQYSIFLSFSFDSLAYIWFGTTIIYMIQIWIRATLPRYVMENIMDIGWKFALPFNLLMIFAIINFVYFLSFILTF